MGYEVLDTDGSPAEPSAGRPDDAARAHDVVELTDPAAPGAGAPVRVPPVLDRLRRSASLPLLVALAVGSLVVGLTAGSLWAHHRSRLAADAARQSQLSVVALVTAVSVVRAQRTADFTVRLVNGGPLPLSLVESPPGARAELGHPLVRDLGGAEVVPPGGSLTVDVQTVVDCTSTVDPTHQISVPVRTQDGSVHHVQVSADASLDSQYSPDSPCAAADYPVLEATFVGTVVRPVLSLRNNTDEPVAVALDREHSPFISQTSTVPVLRLTPALPQVIAPRDTLRLKVQLTPKTCPRDLAAIADRELSPYVVLRAGPPKSPALIREPVGLDLSTIWGAALARACG